MNRSKVLGKFHTYVAIFENNSASKMARNFFQTHFNWLTKFFLPDYQWVWLTEAELANLLPPLDSNKPQKISVMWTNNFWQIIACFNSHLIWHMKRHYTGEQWFCCLGYFTWFHSIRGHWYLNEKPFCPIRSSFPAI